MLSMYTLTLEKSEGPAPVPLGTLKPGDVCEDSDGDVFLVGEGGWDDLIVLGGPSLMVGSRYPGHTAGTQVTPRAAKLVFVK